MQTGRQMFSKNVNIFLVTYYNNTGPGKYVLFLLQQGITNFFGIVALLSYSVLSFCSFFILSRDKTSFSL